MRDELSTESIYKAADKALTRLRTDKNWYDWLTVGRAFLEGRKEAERLSGAMVGSSAYNREFGAWLNRHPNYRDSIDKAVRGRLLQVMEHEAEITAWRATLTTSERMAINHPSAVWRKFEKTNQPPQPKMSKAAGRLMSETSVLNEEAARARETLEELIMTDDADSNAERFLRQMRALGLSKRRLTALVEDTLAAIRTRFADSEKVASDR